MYITVAVRVPFLPRLHIREFAAVSRGGGEYSSLHPKGFPATQGAPKIICKALSQFALHYTSGILLSGVNLLTVSFYLD